MAGKNKGGREARKPKQAQNKKVKGQTPPPSMPLLDNAKPAAPPAKR